MARRRVQLGTENRRGKQVEIIVAAIGCTGLIVVALINVIPLSL